MPCQLVHRGSPMVRTRADALVTAVQSGFFVLTNFLQAGN
jgi:hypothetical protein